MKITQILNRFYVNNMDQALKFYEELLNEKCANRFAYPEVNLEIARIGNILIICGSDEALKPFKDTQATFLVDNIVEYRNFLTTKGAIIIRDLKKVPTGLNMTVQHNDGTIIEYVEHRK